MDEKEFKIRKIREYENNLKIARENEDEELIKYYKLELKWIKKRFNEKDK